MTSQSCWSVDFQGWAPTASGALRDEDLVERIDRELQEILLNHEPRALAQETIREMRSIAEKFKQRYFA